MNTSDYNSLKNAENMHFWYKARLNLIDKLLKRYGPSSAGSILNIGCGFGTEMKVLQKYGSVVGADKDKKAIELSCQLGNQSILIDIEKDSLKESFNTICAFDILEHLDDDKKVVKNLLSNLEQGGNLIFSVPAFNFLFCYHDKMTGHKKRYTKKLLKSILSEAGYKNIELYYWNSILFLPIAGYRLFKNYILWQKNKPSTDAKEVCRPINSFLFKILNFENNFLNNKYLPFGLTIYGAAKK